jgi:hypothetical protein
VNVVFENLSGVNRRPWSGTVVAVRELVGKTRGGLGIFLVTAADGTSFGAYADELVIVPGGQSEE